MNDPGTGRLNWLLPTALLLTVPAFGGNVVTAQPRPAGLAERLVNEYSTAKSAGITRGACVSPDLKRLAYVHVRMLDRRGEMVEECRVVCDGEPTKRTYTSVHPLHFSAGGKHFAYEAERGRTVFWVLDGREIPNSEHLAFSPDGNHVAYVLHRRDGDVMVVDGKAVPHVFKKIPGPVFSPDSRHLAYRGSTGRSLSTSGFSVVVADGRAEPEFPEVTTPPTYSPNSRLMAYGVSEKRGWSVKVGEHSLPAGGVVAQVLFAPDSRSLAFSTVRRTPTDRGLMAEKHMFVKWQDTEWGPYDHVACMVFSPDARRLAFVVKTGMKWRVVCDGIEGPDFREAWIPQFSPDGRHLAYVAFDEKHEPLVVRDGIKGPADPRDVTWLRFSPDSQHLAYVRRERANFPGGFVCDGLSSPFPKGVTEISWLRFSPDSKHLAYVFGRHRVVVDGLRGPSHARILMPGRWDAVPGKLQYLVVGTKRASLVEVDWPTDRTWEDAFKAAGK